MEADRKHTILLQTCNFLVSAVMKRSPPCYQLPLRRGHCIQTVNWAPIISSSTVSAYKDKSQENQLIKPTKLNSIEINESP